ncbi:hypothetical protein D3C75_1310700 [compost metagenome]
MYISSDCLYALVDLLAVSVVLPDLLIDDAVRLNEERAFLLPDTLEYWTIRIPAKEDISQHG